MSRRLPPHAVESFSAAAAALAGAVKAAVLIAGALAADDAYAMESGTRVEVFTTSDLPARRIPSAEGIEIVVWRLDGIVQAQEVLSEGLPADERRAARIAAERFERLKHRLEPRMMEAARGLAHAVLEDGIDRYPAIVFHEPGRAPAVIYGMTDVSAAIAIRERQGDPR